MTNWVNQLIKPDQARWNKRFQYGTSSLKRSQDFKLTWWRPARPRHQNSARQNPSRGPVLEMRQFEQLKVSCNSVNCNSVSYNSVSCNSHLWPCHRAPHRRHNIQHRKNPHQSPGLSWHEHWTCLLNWAGVQCSEDPETTISLVPHLFRIFISLGIFVITVLVLTVGSLAK